MAAYDVASNICQAPPHTLTCLYVREVLSFFSLQFRFLRGGCRSIDCFAVFARHMHLIPQAVKVTCSCHTSIYVVSILGHLTRSLRARMGG
jgi:hypothetical protein